MLVQALADYADTYLAAQLNDAAWESKPVPWQLEISPQGTLLGVVPRTASVARGKKTVALPLPMDVPRSPVKRNSGHHPLLAADDIAYVLGVGPWTPAKAAEREKTQKHHEAFVALIARAACHTGDHALAACARFYQDSEQVEQARQALREAKAGSLVALSVDGPLCQRESVRAYWRDHYQAAFTERMKDSVGECLISGKLGPIAPTHEAIKGVSNLGGQPAGVALMSFDKAAFQSYGWEQNENSPVSPGRALAYVLALNALLRSNDAKSSRQGRRVDIAGIGFLTWLRHPEDFDALDLLESADPDQVRALLRLDPGAVVNDNRFFLVGVSGNGGRLRVRYWVTESLSRIKRNLKEWHEQLRVTLPGAESRPVPLWQLRYAIHRDGKPPAHYAIALLRRAIEGTAQPLGHAMLAAALARLRHPGEDSPGPQEKHKDPYSLRRLRIPAALIRMCINDLATTNPKGGRQMNEGLDPACTLPAYVCGRLLAEFENLQWESVKRERVRRTDKPAGEAGKGELNLTVTDRYFALASTYPAVAFPKIETLAQKHLRKLRRDSMPAAKAIDRRLAELHGLLVPAESGAFPGKLGLEGQGLFVLGYYHQKAWSVAQAIERRQANEDGNRNSEEEN